MYQQALKIQMEAFNPEKLKLVNSMAILYFEDLHDTAKAIEVSEVALNECLNLVEERKLSWQTA